MRQELGNEVIIRTGLFFDLRFKNIIYRLNMERRLYRLLDSLKSILIDCFRIKRIINL